MAWLSHRIGRRPGDATRNDAAEIDKLIQSRRVIVSAYEIERRRIERDLHDGAQQTLVAASMNVGEALCLPEAAQPGPLRDLLEAAQANIERSLRALRHTVHGIHPQALEELSLLAALEDAFKTLDDVVTLRCPQELPPLPEGVLATAYFATLEAVTNACKYAPGAAISVLVTCSESLRIIVIDAGPGGAVIRPGGGLEGMRERLAAIDGSLEVLSPPGGPTKVVASIPLLLYRDEPSVVVSPQEGTHAPRPR
ncbi:MAG: histidine kinase [Actinomycetaceae bacterium]|nr:histidine kinase [Actinomycetaceae bacterium]MDU0970240.1 histidine kinase [Actinomycetaceae bacterium]